MIRLPATSISLSERDIQVHLTHIKQRHDRVREEATTRSNQECSTADCARSAFPRDHNANRNGYRESQQRWNNQFASSSRQVQPLGAEGQHLGAVDTNAAGTDATNRREPRMGAASSRPLRQSDQLPGNAAAGRQVVPCMDLERTLGEDLPVQTTHPTTVVSSSLEEEPFPTPISPDRDGPSVASVAPRTPVRDSDSRVTHVPRQSSLLRFAQRVSSDTSSSPSDPDPTVVLQPRTYRQRTETYSYEQSEADSEYSEGTYLEDEQIINFLSQLELDSPTDDARVDEEEIINVMPGAGLDNPLVNDRAERPSWGRSPSGLRAEAATFVPMNIPPPFSSTPRRVSSQASMPFSAQSSTLSNDNYEIRERSTSLLPQFPQPPPRTSSLVGFQRSPEDMPSSPPEASSPWIPSLPSQSAGFSQLPSPTLPPQLPTTPSPAHGAVWIRTEPRRDRQHYSYLDGQALPVYNDSLPASSQPQTPADVARRRLITEYDATYTAPPGMIQNRADRLHGGFTADERDPRLGERSPIVRAMEIRGRMNREIARSTRFLQRLRARDAQRVQELVRAPVDGPNELDGPRPAIDTWRDVLEADRVGEENFEEVEAALDRGTGLRVVSGNAAPWRPVERRE